MKVTNESITLSADTSYSERQVLLYPPATEDAMPGTMEDIKINIVNDRATGLKRQREETTSVTPCAKKLCSVVFKCSTPKSSSLPSWSSPSTSKSKGANQRHVSTPSLTLEEISEFSDELDDSLLEPSDNEDDSPLYLTVDEIESLLEDEPSGLDECNSTCIVTPESEDDMDKVCTSPCSQLDGSNTMTEATLCEEELNNYATMASSLSRSVIHTVEVQVSKQKSTIVGNVNSSDSEQETNGMSTSAVPILDKMEAPTNQLASDCSADLPVQSPNSLYTVDVVVEWNDDPELSFDGDIDNLLAISPKGDTSSEEEKAAEPCIQCTEQMKSAVSDLTNPSKYSNSVSVNQLSNSIASDAADVVQQLSPSIFKLSDTLQVHRPSSIVPEPPNDSGSPSTSTVVNSETQSNTDAAEDVKPSTSKESDPKSTVGLTDQPVTSSAAQTSSSQQTLTAPGANSSAASQEKSSAAVTPLPRPAARSLPSFELENDKNNYCDQVLMHIEGPEGANSLADPLHELASLLNQYSRDNPNWQHPSNFSRRNHPRCGKKPSKRCTLNEWAENNGGTTQRFKNVPSSFQRNPIPEVLPF